MQRQKKIPRPPFFTLCDGLLSSSLEELFFQSVNILEYALTSVHRKNMISFTNHLFSVDSRHSNTHVCFHSGYLFHPLNFPVLEACIYFNKSFQLNIFSFSRYEVSTTTSGKLPLLSLSTEIQHPPTHDAPQRQRNCLFTDWKKFA